MWLHIKERKSWSQRTKNLADYIKAKGIVIEDSVLEELGIMLSSNKTDVLALLKGKTVEDVLGTETDDD